MAALAAATARVAIGGLSSAHRHGPGSSYMSRGGLRRRLHRGRRGLGGQRGRGVGRRGGQAWVDRQCRLPHWRSLLGQRCRTGSGGR